MRVHQYDNNRDRTYNIHHTTRHHHNSRNTYIMPLRVLQHAKSKAGTVSKSTTEKLKTKALKLYGWGQSKHNILPATADDAVNESSSSASSLLGGGSTVYDHPIPLNVDTINNSSSDDTVDVATTMTIAGISAGQDSSGLTLSNGCAMVWGSNASAQLGVGNKNKEITTPTMINLNKTENGAGIQKLVLGYNHSALIDEGGDLYTFGHGGSVVNGMGCLGHGDGSEHLVPKRVESLVEDGCFVDDVCVGKSHTTVLTTEGELLTTGSGSWGRLGNLDTEDQLFLEPVEMLAGSQVVQIASGHEFTLALTSDGIVHGWGRNDKGQLGTGGGIVVDMYSMAAMPTPVEGQLEGRRVAKIAAGHGHAACITDQGELFFWGIKMYLEPVLISSLLHTKCIDVACGNNYTCVVTEDGRLYTFGKGKHGVLAQASKSDIWQPALVEGLLGNRVVSMATGDHHVLCLVEENEKEEESGSEKDKA